MYKCLKMLCKALIVQFDFLMGIKSIALGGITHQLIKAPIVTNNKWNLP